MAKLVINPTSAAKKEIPLVSRVISIGRDPSNDLVLSDSMVSRRHAILEHRDDHYVLRDNGSSNGTLVNGDRVDSEKLLRDGDLVAIGSSRLLFQLDDTAAASVVPALLPRAEGSSSAPPAAEAPPATRCPACGMAAVPSDRFCRSCGREIERLATKATCAHCGSENLLPADFCGRCGKAIGLPKSSGPSSTRPNRRAELESAPPPPSSASSASSASSPPSPPSPPIERSPAPGPSRKARVSPPKSRASGPFEDAGFGVRFLAFLVDEIILGIPLLLGGLVWMAVSFGSESGPGAGSAFAGALLGIGYSVLGLLYYVVLWGGRGTTPGKSLLGLVVRTTDGETPIGYPRALLRLVGYGVCFALLGLGFLPILVSSDRRGLHDRIAGTRVTRSS